MRKKLLLISIALGIVFDILFWKQVQGISFAIFIYAALLSSYLLLHKKGAQPDKKSYLLLIPLSFFSIMTFIRIEPFTSFLNYAVSLLSFVVLMMTYQNGLWLQYSMSDFIVNFLHLAGNMLGFPWMRPDQLDLFEKSASNGNKNSRPVIRGILLAIPVFLLFLILLSSADLVFSRAIDQVLDTLNIKQIGEYMMRGFIIFFIANLFVGTVIYAFVKSRDRKLIGTDKPVITKFLGYIEASIILGSVLALFIIFVTIQFRYFFFGQSVITQLGFTYSEYARRGFGELVAVSVFSLLLVLGLSTITKRESSRQKKTFSAMAIGLVGLVLVILISAFQRLYLYEWAYGFTRLRTYSHIFMVWLGILLVATVVLEAVKYQRGFAVTAFLVLMGFTATLNLLNVDAFIVRQNIFKAQNGEALDADYLSTLSTDAVPPLVKAYTQPSLPLEIKGEIFSAIADYSGTEREDDPLILSWQSFHFSRWKAGNIVKQIKD